LIKNGKSSKTRQNSTTAKSKIVVFELFFSKKCRISVQMFCVVPEIDNFVFDFWISGNLTILAIFQNYTEHLYRNATIFEKKSVKNGLFLEKFHEKSWKIGHFWPKNSDFWRWKKLKLNLWTRMMFDQGFLTAAKKRARNLFFFLKKSCFFRKKNSLFLYKFTV